MNNFNFEEQNTKENEEILIRSFAVAQETKVFRDF